mmetsp:Transcript_14972/g.43252  ORF Transcript_14972/g.43252 Transcript_14972/m.43252 type:complete len:374 (-) Transcript_14972:71-1192(-)|eukprot:CAMPEP_0181052874 /NCGR_PEP_ID=MMETSP1070-20121207/17817_1 /TAXON_ID=265543 /ORGANISM="Minutocellus polymorphus, Strain NH13" /LENGTH=373 /DNA_ID=CAMNT_0023131985 /DNA_START=27 /DNA_END=1148 /DNA_ORIENTATION=+
MHERGMKPTPKHRASAASSASAAAAGSASPAKRRKTTSGRDRNWQQRQPDRGGRGGGRGGNRAGNNRNRKRDRDRRSDTNTNNARSTYLRACSSISSIVSQGGDNNKNNNSGTVTVPTLHWESPNSHPVIEAEESLLPQLLKYGKKERGMFRTKPSWLVERVEQLSRYNGIDLIQALSLRRTHMKLLNPGMDMAKLRLGSNDNVRASAALFEEAVEDYLHAQDVPFITEEEQQRAHKEKNGIHTKNPPTPDFIFPQPTRLRYTTTSDGAAADGTADDSSMPLINFLEVKMFYGASTIPDETSNAVGLIMPKLKRYVELYGPGAIVFSFGCGQRLAEKLASIGVVALDAHPLDLSQMKEHQRSWCADDTGRILP